MKINFAQKTIKILTITIFGVFVLVLINVKIINGANFSSNSSSPDDIFMHDVSSSVGNTSSVSSEDNNPYTNTGESTTGFEQSSTDNDKNNDGIDDAFQPDNPLDYKVMEDRSETTDNFTYTLLQPLPQEGEDLQENVTLEEYLTWAYKFVLALAGFLAVMMIVIGGVEWIISGANESMRSEAKKRITNAIWGLVMALAAYLVLYTINPSLVDFNNNQFFKTEETTDSENENDVPLVEGQGGEFGGTGATGSW